ncbi:hypothetical protein VTK26DRAFT_4821 [Humicola hyalothermophila]
MIQPANPYPRKKVAVVGSGCAGIAALWALNRSPHDVYIYEAEDRLGGHTNTVEFIKGKYKALVDTGFIVMNTATYPNFINFLKRMRVETVPTEMSFSVSRDRGSFEWAGSSLDTLFCQRGNLLSPKMWRMSFDIVRFNHFALDVLRAENPTDETIGEYLEREGYSNAFRDDYLIPMTAAVWSTGPDKCMLDFPVDTLIRFLWNHHLLSTVAARPTWLTIATGSKSYIDKVMRGFPPNHLRLNTRVTALTHDANGRLRLHTENGSSDTFDHVILATHGDQAYSIIRDWATDEERAILQAFRTSENTAVLHSDTSLMPSSRKAWSSWNYLTTSPPPSPATRSSRTSTTTTTTVSDVSQQQQKQQQVCVTYDLNTLQHVPRSAFGPVLLTLNPLREPDPASVQARFVYRHPLYTPAAVRAQRLLGRIQNTRGVSYAGAWTGYGFHEDGFTSGLRVAVEHLGAKVPFEVIDSTFARGRRPELGVGDWVVRAVVWLVQVFVVGVVERLMLMVGVVAAADGGAPRRWTKRVAFEGVNGGVLEERL